MEDLNFSGLSPDDKKRTAYIEGREDLFETKVFKIDNKPEATADNKKNILIICRDPGGANALLPVMKILQDDEDVVMRVITDGRAQEILQKNLQMTDITPKDSVLNAELATGHPDAVLMNSSTERGIDMYVTATYDNAPIVLIEDYFGSSPDYLKRLKDRNLPWPSKICVMDKEVKNIILTNFPELEDIIEITGQPIFDRFSTENTGEIAAEVRKELELGPDEKVVVFISAMDDMELIKEMAKQFSKVKDKFKFVFRLHPRDNIPYGEYERIFKEAGIDCVDTRGIDMNKVGTIADLAITVSSTEVLNAIYRRKPTIHIHNPKSPKYHGEVLGYDLTLPPVKLGASVGVPVEDLTTAVKELLNPESDKNTELQKQMNINYPIDGKNAERVANVLKGIIQ